MTKTGVTTIILPSPGDSIPPIRSDTISSIWHEAALHWRAPSDHTVTAFAVLAARVGCQPRLAVHRGLIAAQRDPGLCCL